MNHNRLSDLFMALDFEELREISKFVRSPIFNQQEKVVALFDYIRKRRTRGWSNENIFRKLYPNERYDVQKVHQLNSNLLQLIEQYLAWREWKNNGIQSDLDLLKAYRKKNLNKHFEKTLRNIHSKMDHSPYRNETYHQSNYQLQKEAFLYERERGRTVKFNLQELSNTQDIHFIADKLKHACTLLSHQTMVSKDYDKGLLNQVLNTVEQNPDLQNHPAVSIYYQAYCSLNNLTETSSFEMLKNLMDSHIQKFFPSEQRDIYILAINYCIRKINSNVRSYFKEVNHLYKKGLQDGVFIEHGILSRWTYNNIIISGLKMRDFDWVEQFIHSYKPYLDEKTREDSFNYNLARFHFEKKDYDTTMPLLLKTKFDDLLHNLGAKTMLAKMYFELKEWDALDNLLESFRVYINRKKDIGYHKENYMNIISFIKKLTQLQPYEKSYSITLEQQILSTQSLTEKEWLIQQIHKIAS